MTEDDDLKPLSPEALAQFEREEREAFEAFMRERQPLTEAERAAVSELGERIGLGRVLQVALDLCAEANPANAPMLGPGVDALVPCPQCADGLDEGETCEWCCGVQRVTHRIAKAIADLGR